ncbi:MAG: HD domain-containing protein [Clostridia bacterium]|nr:HD domain-containing protein [Clostridia bacterium]MDD4680615.1 HD domain-containing protein [Clostridia bacterium]
MNRLQKQIEFIVEVDKLKHVLRQSVLINDRRRENDAEHSWHLAVMAMLLSEHVKEDNLDLFKVMKMVLIHDIVEIDAGDTFAYDEEGYEDKEEREMKAAQRIFNLLPTDQAIKMKELWLEFEEKATPESRYAASLDRLQPLLLNYHSEGHTWKMPGVTSEKVYERMAVIKESTPQIWDYVVEIVEDSIDRGYLKR